MHYVEVVGVEPTINRYQRFAFTTWLYLIAGLIAPLPRRCDCPVSGRQTACSARDSES